MEGCLLRMENTTTVNIVLILITCIVIGEICKWFIDVAFWVVSYFTGAKKNITRSRH